jgi:hypothetical protein
MATFTKADLTWNGKEIQSLDEAIFEKTYITPAYTAFHKMYEGIKAKQQIAKLERLNLVGRTKGAVCDISESSQTAGAVQKYWEPAIIADKFGNCYKDVEESFFIWGTDNGISRDDLTSTDFAVYMAELISDGLMKEFWRVGWFGDTDAANYNDSPAGVITDGVDVDYFNAIDGFWKQLFAIGDGTAARKVSIAKNAGNSYANQTFDATDTTNKVATGIFADLKYNADFRLRQQENLVIVSTQKLVDQYAKELRSQSLDASFVRIENGYNSIMFEGIPIIAVPYMDVIIDSYFDNGTKWYRPHRAVLTTTDNLGVGVETIGNLGEFDMWFSKDDNKNYVRTEVSMDVKAIDDDLVQVAY